jgi:monoamine oxidase
MFVLENKNVLVIGLGLSGVAATKLLLSRGANVAALDSADNKSLRAQAMSLRDLGAHVDLAALKLPRGDLILPSSVRECRWRTPWWRKCERGIFRSSVNSNLAFSNHWR